MSNKKIADTLSKQTLDANAADLSTKIGPWLGVPPELQDACAVVGCAEHGKPHRCPYDGSFHHHGCVHYQEATEHGTHAHGLKFRKGWAWLCDKHYADLCRPIFEAKA